MEFIEDQDEMFQPLIDYLNSVNNPNKEEVLSQYMYMGSKDKVHYYKHFATREYIHIKDGRLVLGGLEDWKKWA